METDHPHISPEFIEENKKLVTTSKIPGKKGGPYSKVQRIQRRQEVFRLHFELGYPVTRIAQMMKVNPNTVTSDINVLYRQLSKEWDSYDIEAWLMKQTHRLEMQRTRMLEELKKAKSTQDKLAVEKMLFDIDTHVMNTAVKIWQKNETDFQSAANVLNDFLDKQNPSPTSARFFFPRGVLKVGSKTRKKIDDLIRKDTKEHRGTW